jgi:DNA repair exonuclease SbcCD nuclease subunit
MISGNHDPEAANSHYVTYKWCENVSFITKNIKSIYFEELNTEVFGLGWVLGTGQAALLNDMNLVPTRINVLLFHGDVDLQIGIRDYNSISSQLLETKSFDYIAAGHNHKRKTGEINGIFYNPGSLEPLGFDEPGIHGFFSGTIIKGMSPDVAFIKNSSTIYETIKIDINGISKNHQIIDEILPKLTSLNHLYKIILTGNKSLDYNPDTTYITSALEDKALFIKLVDNSKVWVSINELSLLKGLKGIFARKMLEKMKNSDEFEQKLLEKALYYGIEAIENGRIEQAGGDLL